MYKVTITNRAEKDLKRLSGRRRIGLQPQWQILRKNLVQQVVARFRARKACGDFALATGELDI